MDIATLGYEVDSRGLVRGTVALDKHTAAAGRSDKATDKLEASWKRMGKTIGLGVAAIGGIAVAAFAKYIRNTIEAEKVQSQLASRIKDTGGIAKRSVEQLNDTADALQRLTTFDDEAIGEVQAMLLTFKNIRGDIFDDATASVLDLATAMGTDANSAALQLGKALNDPIKGIAALGRAGIQFSSDQKKVIEGLITTGKVAEAQRLILKEVEGQMGTAAEAARNTLGGALEGLKNTVDNLLEGDSGGDGMKGMVSAVNDLNSSLNDPELKSGIDALAEGILAAANAAVKAVAKLGNLISKYREFLSSKGFAIGDDDTSMEDLLTRREKLYKKAAAAQTSMFGGMTSGPLIKELERTDALISKARFRGVTTNVDSTALGKITAEPEEPISTGGSGSKKAMKLPDFSEGAAKELQELIAAQVEARGEFDSMAATLAGPMAEASYRYAVDLEKLRELSRQGEVGTDELTKAEANLAAQHKLTMDSIEEGLNPTRKMLEDLEFERDLIGKTNIEREIAIAQRWAHVDAMSAEGKSLAGSIRLNRELEQAQGAQIETMDSLRDAGKGFIVDMGNGAKPIDAIGDALDRVYQKMLSMAAEKLMDQIFGKQGEAAGGSSSGWLGALMGLFTGGGAATGATGDVAFGASSFGGGFARGGYTGAGGKHDVAGLVHAGEYVLNSEATRRLGLPFLGALNSMDGYANGGLVGLLTNEKGPERIQHPKMRIPIKRERRTALMVAA